MNVPPPLRSARSQWTIRTSPGTNGVIMPAAACSLIHRSFLIIGGLKWVL